MILDDSSINSKFEEVYLAYFSKMKYFAKEYVLSEGDAENIVQDVFTELWEKKEILTMHKTVVQETASLIQEEYAITLQMNLNSLEAFDEDLFSEEDVEKIISRAFDSLSDKCREIFIMSKLEGKKQKQIAEELNISINTIETQMGIAYKKLRVELKDYMTLFLFLFSL